jgi:hypothetical protein
MPDTPFYRFPYRRFSLFIRYPPRIAPARTLSNITHLRKKQKAVNIIAGNSSENPH